MKRSLTLLTITLVSFLSFQYAFTMNKAIESIQKDSSLKDDKKKKIVEKTLKARKLIEQEAFKEAFPSFDYHFALMGFLQSDFPLTTGRSRDEQNASCLIADALFNGERIARDLCWMDITDHNGKVRDYKQYLVPNTLDTQSDELKAYELLSAQSVYPHHRDVFITSILHWIKLQNKDHLSHLVKDPFALKKAFAERRIHVFGKETHALWIESEVLALIPFGRFTSGPKQLTAVDAASCDSKSSFQCDENDKIVCDAFTSLVLRELLYVIYNHKVQLNDLFQDIINNNSNDTLILALLKLIHHYSQVDSIEADKLLYIATEWDIVPLMQASLLYIVANCDDQQLVQITSNMHWSELKRCIDIMPLCAKRINENFNVKYKELPVCYDKVALKAVTFIIKSVCEKIINDQMAHGPNTSTSTERWSSVPDTQKAQLDEVAQAIADKIFDITTLDKKCLNFLLQDDASLTIGQKTYILKESENFAYFKECLRQKLADQVIVPTMYLKNLHRYNSKFALLHCSFLNPIKVLCITESEPNYMRILDLSKGDDSPIIIPGGKTHGINKVFVVTSRCQCFFDKKDKHMVFGNFDINAPFLAITMRYYETRCEDLVYERPPETAITRKWGELTWGFDWPWQPLFVKGLHKDQLLIADEKDVYAVTDEGVIIKKLEKYTESDIGDIVVDENSVMILYHDNSICIYDVNKLQLTRIIRPPIEVEDELRIVGESPVVTCKALNETECIISYANDQLYIYDKKESAKEPFLLNSLHCYQQSSMRTALMPEGHAISFAHIDENVLAIGYEGGTVKIIDRYAQTVKTIECSDYATYGYPINLMFDRGYLNIIYSKGYRALIFFPELATLSDIIDNVLYFQENSGLRDMHYANLDKILKYGSFRPLCNAQKMPALSFKNRSYLLNPDVIIQQNKNYCHILNLKTKAHYSFQFKKLAQAAFLDDHTLADYDSNKQHVVFMDGLDGRRSLANNAYSLVLEEHRKDAFYWPNQVTCMSGLDNDCFIIADDAGISIVDRIGKRHQQLESCIAAPMRFKHERDATKVKELIVDKSFIIALYVNGTLKIWDRNTYQYISTIALPTDIPCKADAFQGEIHCVPLNNEKIMVGYSDGSARIFDIKTGTFECQYVIPGNTAIAKCFAEINQRYLSIGYTDGYVRFFDKTSKKVIKSIPTPGADKYPVLLALSERNTLLIVYKGIEALIEWDLQSVF